MIGNNNDGRLDIILTGSLTKIYRNDTNGVFTDINAADPPTTEAVTGEFTIYDAANDTQLTGIGYDGSNVFEVRNYFDDSTAEIHLLMDYAASSARRLSAICS